MLYAKLETSDTLYVFLHAEQIYRDFSLSIKDSGYFNYELAESTISDIYNYIKGNSTPNNIVFDFAEIKEAHNITEWIERIINYCRKHSKDFAFSRMGEKLYKESKTKLENKLGEEDETITDFNSAIKNKNITDTEIFEIYQKTIAEKIKSKYLIERVGKDSYSHSSNVQLPKYINIKAFIEQKDLSFLGIYLLCKKAIHKEFVGYDKHPLLFFSSMAGSYLASVFSKLACIDMVFLNHLGPKKKLYRELHKEQLLADRDYLIISDVICLGAEIERAKTLIEHAGGKLKGILSIVFVEVVSERPKTDNEIEKVSLLTLTKEYNPIDYQIITDFPKK